MEWHELYATSGYRGLDIVNKHMRQNNIFSYFRQWLEDSSERFYNKPILFDERKGRLCFRFEDAAPELIFTLCDNGNATVDVIYQNHFRDIVAEFDVMENKTGSGKYYCHGCKEKKLYSSRKHLFVEHVFEPLLDWVNANLNSSNWLCVFKAGGAAWASIVDEENVPAAHSQEDFVIALPIIVNLTQ